MANNRSNKRMGIVSSSFLLVGSMFGSAIFSLSGLTIYEAGPASLLTWLIAAILMLMYGLYASELAIYYPKSGGIYVFPKKAIPGKKGKFLAWITCWGYLIGNFAAIAFSSIYVGIYLGVSFEWANDFTVVLSIGSIAVCFLLNIIKLKNASKLNIFMVSCLVVIAVIFIVVAISNKDNYTSALCPFFTQGHSGSFGFLSMVPTAIVAYGAVSTVAFMASEVKNPKKTIPISCVIAIAIIAALYLLIIFSCVLYVNQEFINNNPSLKMVPLFAVCSQLHNSYWLACLISIAAVLSLLTTILALIAINARAIQAAAKDGILPKFFASMSNNSQPIMAIIVTSIIPAVFACLPNFVSEIISLGIIFNVLKMIIILVSLLFARRQLSKSYNKKFLLKNFFVVFFIILLFICSIANIIYTNLLLVGIYTLIIFILGALIYFLSNKRSIK